MTCRCKSGSFFSPKRFPRRRYRRTVFVVSDISTEKERERRIRRIETLEWDRYDGGGDFLSL